MNNLTVIIFNWLRLELIKKRAENFKKDFNSSKYIIRSKSFRSKNIKKKQLFLFFNVFYNFFVFQKIFQNELI